MQTRSRTRTNLRPNDSENIVSVDLNQDSERVDMERINVSSLDSNRGNLLDPFLAVQNNNPGTSVPFQPVADLAAVQRMDDLVLENRELRVQLQKSNDRFYALEQRLNQLQPVVGENALLPVRVENQSEVLPEVLERGNSGRFAHSLKPDHYSGSVPFEIFIAQFNIWSVSMDEGTKLNSLVSLLRAPVTNLLDTLPINFSYNLLIERLQARFGRHKDIQQFRVELRRFGLSSVETYYNQVLQLQDLVARAHPESSMEEQEALTLTTFAEALREVDPTSFALFTIKQFVSVNQVGQFLLNVLPQSSVPVSVSEQRGRSSFRPICFSCGRSGHLAPYCPESKKRKYNSGNE